LSDEQSTVDTDSEEQEEKKPLDLNVEIDAPSACERHITVTIARADVDEYFDKAYAEIMPKAEVPGFRPGRAPQKLVRSRFRDQVSDQVKSSLLMDSMSQISDGFEFSPISEPDFDLEAVVLPEEGDMTFEFDLEVRPEFDLPAWKGMSLERPVRDFTEEDVNDHLKRVLSSMATMTDVEGAAEADDYVTCDVTFSHDSREISRAKNQRLQVKPRLTFPDGEVLKFDELMTGAAKGDRRETTVTISPDATQADLRDQEVKATFTVKTVERQQLPEIDEELLSNIGGGFDTEEELREAVRSEMERQLTYHQDREIREQISNLLTESATWDLPPHLLSRQAERELHRTVLELQRSGFGSEEIQSVANDLRRNSRESTARSLKEHFILERIAEDLNIDASDDDYDDEIELIADSQNQSPRSVRAQLEKRNAMDTLRNQIVERKVLDEIKKEAKFTDTDYQQRSSDTTATNFAITGEQEDGAIPAAQHDDSAVTPDESTDVPGRD